MKPEQPFSYVSDFSSSTSLARQTPVPCQRHIIEGDTRPRHAHRPSFFERGPTPLVVALNLAVGFGALRFSTIHRGIQMLLVPKLRAERVLLVHMDVIEAFGRHIPLVLDNRAVRALQVGETRTPGRFHTLSFAFGQLRLGPTERSCSAR